MKLFFFLNGKDLDVGSSWEVLQITLLTAAQNYSAI